MKVTGPRCLEVCMEHLLCANPEGGRGAQRGQAACPRSHSEGWQSEVCTRRGRPPRPPNPLPQRGYDGLRSGALALEGVSPPSGAGAVTPLLVAQRPHPCRGTAGARGGTACFCPGGCTPERAFRAASPDAPAPRSGKARPLRQQVGKETDSWVWPAEGALLLWGLG